MAKPIVKAGKKKLAKGKTGKGKATKGPKVGSAAAEMAEAKQGC